MAKVLRFSAHQTSPSILFKSDPSHSLDFKLLLPVSLLRSDLLYYGVHHQLNSDHVKRPGSFGVNTTSDLQRGLPNHRHRIFRVHSLSGAVYFIQKEKNAQNEKVTQNIASEEESNDITRKVVAFRNDKQVPTESIPHEERRLVMEEAMSLFMGGKLKSKGHGYTRDENERRKPTAKVSKNEVQENGISVPKARGYCATGASHRLNEKKLNLKGKREYSTQTIIAEAEKLIDADSSLHTNEDDADERAMQEKAWLKLLLDVQKTKLAKAEKLKLVLHLLDVMYDSGIRVNAMHICAAISVCVIEKAMKTAEKILERAHSSGSKASVNAFVYSKLIQGYCSSDQRKEAFALLAKMDMQHVKHDVVIYNTLLETEQSQEGVEVLIRGMEARSIQPNDRTYCAAIRCYGRSGQLGAVRKLWQNMATSGVTFTVFSFQSLLDAYANVGDVEACKLIMHEMGLRKLTVSKDSYNTLLKAYARSRDAGGAVRVLRNMQRKGLRLDIVTYNTVMDACVRGRGMLRALSLGMELPLHGLQPDATTFAILLRGAGLLRDASLVRKVLYDMKTSRCPHDEVTYRCAVFAFVHCGEGGSALEILERMSAAGAPPAMTVPEVLIKSVDAALLRECTAAAPAGRLQQFLSDMAAAGLSPTRETGGSIVRKLAHSRGVHVALDVAGEFLRVAITNLGLYTWQSVLGACIALAEEKPLLAAAAVSRSLELMKAEGTSPDRMIYESAISIYIKCGDGERAIALYERMQTAKLSPANKEEGKDPLERMLLDTMDAALVGALAANLEVTWEDGNLQGDSETRDQLPTRATTATIMQDLADAGIRVKPGAVTSVIRQLCADDSIPVRKSQGTGVLAIRKPAAGSPPPVETPEALAQDRRVQRLERAMGLVEASNCLFGMQVTSFVYGALMEACIRLQQDIRVEFLWQRMRSEGVTPDVGTWVSRIRALGSVGSIKGHTHELLAEAALDRLELDSTLLRAMLKACHQVRDTAGVAHVRRMLDTSGRAQLSVELNNEQITDSSGNSRTGV